MLTKVRIFFRTSLIQPIFKIFHSFSADADFFRWLEAEFYFIMWRGVDVFDVIDINDKLSVYTEKR